MKVEKQTIMDPSYQATRFDLSVSTFLLFLLGCLLGQSGADLAHDDLNVVQYVVEDVLKETG